MDIGSLAEIRAGVAEGHKAMGRIDVLVNNVGIGPEAPAENVSEADFDQTINVNLKGTFFVSQTVGRLMIAQGGGRIVNISSQAGTVALRTESVYCMTKAAINHLTRCLAFEWAAHGINVNSVAPTFIWTDGTRPYLNEAANRAQVLGHIPLGRIGEPNDVVGAVIFLASPAASLITGANLMIDGGWSLG
jgi:NAD(P)-dependent dehydrogenase (short-subunit alcohol dehydrogenase family)